MAPIRSRGPWTEFYTQEAVETALLAYQHLVLPALASWDHCLELLAARANLEPAFNSLDNALTPQGEWAEMILSNYRDWPDQVAGELPRASGDLARLAREEGSAILKQKLGFTETLRLPRVRAPFLERYPWGLPFLLVACWARSRGISFFALWPATGTPVLRLEHRFALVSAEELHGNIEELKRRLGRIARAAERQTLEINRRVTWLLVHDIFGLSEDEIALLPDIGLASASTIARGIKWARRPLRELSPPWRILVPTS